MMQEKFKLGRSEANYFVNESKQYAHSLGLIFAYDSIIKTFNCTDDEEVKRRLLRDVTKNSIAQQRSLKLHMQTAFDTDVITGDLYLEFLGSHKKQNQILAKIG